MEINRIFTYKRSSYHVAVACFIHQIQRTSHLAVFNRMTEGNQPQDNGEQDQQVPELEVPPNLVAQESLEEQKQTLQEHLLPMILQQQQILANSSAENTQNIPNLNRLVANQIQNELESNLHRNIVEPAELESLQDVKTATQRQLAEL